MAANCHRPLRSTNLGAHHDEEPAALQRVPTTGTFNLGVSIFNYQLFLNELVIAFCCVGPHLAVALGFALLPLVGGHWRRSDIGGRKNRRLADAGQLGIHIRDHNRLTEGTS